MKITQLSKGLNYVGEAVGKRQTYYVFEAGKDYLVFSFRDKDLKSGNFNVVSARNVK